MPFAVPDLDLPALLTLLSKGALLLLAAELAARLLSRRGAAARHLLWTAALGSLLALPLLSGLLPALDVALLEAPVVAPAAGIVPEAAAPVAPAGPTTSPSAPDAHDGSGVREAAAPTWPAALPHPRTAMLLLWGLGTLLLAARVAAGVVAGARLVRRGEPVEDDDWTRRTRRIADDLGLRRPPELIRSADVGIPMAWGLFRPRVLLPEDADGWSAERRDLVLIHELAHVRRGDCLSHLVGQLSHALHWPNPLAWRALGRMLAEREAACDELVLASGASGSDYARLLLDIARGARHREPLPGASVAMARPSQLEGRLLSILNASDAPLGLSRRLRLAVPLAVLALATPVAAVQPWASPTAPAAPPPESGAHVAQGESAAEDELPTGPLASGASPAVEWLMTSLEEIDAGTVAAALSGAQDSDPTVRDRVLEAMLRTLRDPEAGLRRDAAQALGTMESEEAVEGLVTALDDPEPTVRRQAAWALGMIESPRAVDGLLAHLTDDDTGTRKQVAWALGMIESRESAGPLTPALDDPDIGVAEQAAWALGMIESADATPDLTRRLEDAPAGLRAQILWALGMIEDPRAVPGVVPHLQDDAPAVRARAAWALGMIDSTDAVDALVAAVADPSPEVRAQVIWALGMIGDDRATDALLQIMETDESEEIRRAAMQALSHVLG